MVVKGSITADCLALSYFFPLNSPACSLTILFLGGREPASASCYKFQVPVFLSLRRHMQFCCKKIFYLICSTPNQWYVCFLSPLQQSLSFASTPFICNVGCKLLPFTFFILPLGTSWKCVAWDCRIILFFFSLPSTFYFSH